MKCLFYIAKKYSIPIVKPLVDYLYNNTDWEYGFYISEQVKKHFPSQWQENKIKHSLKQARLFKPDFVLCPGNFVDYRIPGIKVQIFHGLGIEKDSHFKIRHFFDAYFTSGPYVTNRFMQLQKRHKYFTVRETGWPKVDYIIKYPTHNIYERFKIPKDKTIILYAPTFSRKMESATDLLEKIPHLIGNDELWLLKFHELMDKEIVEKYRGFDNQKIRIIESYDITPFLHLATIMISDTSSVIYEFMSLKKPVITLNTISRKDKGLDIGSYKEVRNAIEKIKMNPEILESNIKKHMGEVNPYLDGDISKRVFSELEKIFSERILPDKRKPANIFRKLQIVHHGISRKGYLR